MPHCGCQDQKNARVLNPHPLAGFISSVSHAIPYTALAVQYSLLDSQLTPPCSWENIPQTSRKGLQSLTSSVQSNFWTTSHPFWLHVRGTAAARSGLQESEHVYRSWGEARYSLKATRS